jgi:hypothetical protein
MNNPHQRVRCLSRRLGVLLAVRLALQWTTSAFLALGTMALVLRLVLHLPAHQLTPGLLLAIPTAAAAAALAWRRRPDPSLLRAALDCHNRCGGLLMAGEQGDTTAWLAGLPAARLPRPRWNSRRSLTLFAVAAAFVLLALSIPDRYTAGARRRPLQVGQLVNQLNQQLETLAQEKIIDQPQVADLKEKISKLGEESSGVDPARTWEALDHLRQSTAETARKSAEETLAKLETLSQAETLAAALSIASSSNLNEQVSAQAMQELGSLLQNARAEEGVAAGSLPPELLAALKTNGLSADQLSQLLKAIQSGKGRMGQALTNLAELKLIDAALLGKCAGACQGGDTNGLAAFLSECESTNASAGLKLSYGRGGRDRGRGDAPMTWSEGTSEEDARFKAEALPRNAASLSQAAPLVGISRTAPQLTDAQESIAAGVLNPAARGGGSAQSQQVLPRHKPAVERYFKRDP